MKKQFDELVGKALSRWVGLTIAHGRRVSTAVLLLTLGLLAYTIPNLGINSDNVDLLDPDLPSRRALDEFSRLFPILNNALLVVVDAESPELARDAASALAQKLGEQKDLFDNVFIPGGGDFFEKNGLLYRSLDDLYDFSDHMAEVQPILAELERDPSIANMTRLVKTGLEHAETGPIAQEQWAAILDRMSDGAIEVFAPYPLPISWEEFLLSGSALEVSKRRVIMVEPKLDFESFLPAGPPLERIRQTAADLGYTSERGVRVRVTGNPALNYEEMIGIFWNVIAGGVVCFAFVGLVLFMAFRSVRLAIGALATLLVGLVWTAAFAAGAVGHLNLISLAFAVLFIGLGIDFAIHLGMDYAALRQDGLDHRTAMLDAVDYVGSSLVLCSVTTCIGFFAFVPTEYRGVAELGLIAGGGMLVTLFLTLTLFPALLSGWLALPPGVVPKASLRFRSDAPSFLLDHAAAVRWIALAAGIGGLCLLPGISFESNVVQMRDPNTESVQAFNEIAAMNDSGSPWYADALAPDLDAAQALAARLEALDGVSRTLTLASYVPEDQEAKREALADLALLIDVPPSQSARASELSPEEQLQALRDLRSFLASSGFGEGDQLLQASIHRLEDVLDDFIARVDAGEDVAATLAKLEQVLLGQLPVHLARLRNALDPEPIDLASLPESFVDRMIAPDGRARVIAFPADDLQKDGQALQNFVGEIQQVAPDATGLAVNMVEFGKATVKSLRQALVTAVLAIALLLWVLWRRATEMLLVLAPLALGAVLTCAVMVLFGISFNFANVIVIPLMLGIGVDSGIHLVHRANIGSEGEAGVLGSTTARAIFYSAATTIASFGALAFSPHRGVASLGVMLVVGLGFTLLCTLVVLPALIEWRRRSAEA